MDHPLRVEAPAEIAGFWRRILAALIDAMILGLIGWLCARNFEGPLIALGSNGRVIGIAVALAYFGILNSRIGGGASLGKRLIGLRVVHGSGAKIGLGCSILRAAVLAIPVYLNGWMFDLPPLSHAAEIAFFTIDAALVFGVLLANLYLYIANRSTRQVLHDLVAGTYVVYAPGGAVEARMARVHRIVVGVWFALVLIGVPVAWVTLERLGGQNLFGIDISGQTAIYNAVLQEPGVRSAAVMTITSANWVQGKTSHGNFLSVAVTLDHAVSEGEAEAIQRKIALRTLATSPDILGQDLLSVRVSYGYDIGIYSKWRHTQNNGTPDDWKAAAAEK